MSDQDWRIETVKRELPHSVEVTRNAKGEYGWTVKVYFEDTDGLLTVDEITDIDAQLRALFVPLAPIHGPGTPRPS